MSIFEMPKAVPSPYEGWDQPALQHGDKALWRSLTEVERTVIALRFPTDPRKALTHAEVGAITGLTREEVRWTESRIAREVRSSPNWPTINGWYTRKADNHAAMMRERDTVLRIMVESPDRDTAVTLLLAQYREYKRMQRDAHSYPNPLLADYCETVGGDMADFVADTLREYGVPRSEADEFCDR